MIPKPIQDAPRIPTTAISSEAQSAETLKEFLNASFPNGTEDVKGKIYASPESLASKASEGKLQASVRAAELNEQLNAHVPQDPKTKGTAANYQWMVSGIKEENNPAEGTSIIKDYDKGTMTHLKKP